MKGEFVLIRGIGQLSDWMKENDVDVSFLTSTENVFYLSGFHSNPHERLLGLVVFQYEEPFLICPAMDVNVAKSSGWVYEIIGYSDIDQPWELVHKAILRRGCQSSKMAIEKEHMNVERFEILHNLFPQTTFLSAEEKLRQLRMIKTDKELKILRQACELADFAIEIGFGEIKDGKTELEILAAIEFALKKKGVKEMSFSTMV